MPYLVSLSPSLLHREYTVDKSEITVGRDALACDIAVAGETISRRHCKLLTHDHAGYLIQDLNSTNGVYVNGHRLLREAVLAEGDRIGLGSDKAELFRYQLESGRGRPWTVQLAPAEAWSIGRDASHDIALSFDSTVSSRHATIRRKGELTEVIDERSLNGTWVSGRRVRRATLEPTDTVMIGSTALRLQIKPDGGLLVERRDCHEQVALEAIGLTCTVPLRSRPLLGAGPTRRILDQVALSVRPGEFVGLLGPSGAGKSTLLKSLNGYQPPQSGCVLLNDTPLYQSFDMFRNAIGYVPQDDIVHPDLTVRSSLDYVARLRLPPDVSPEQRAGLIDSTLETLGLSHVRESRIFELSGGQRKRVSIGCELITRPSILFLDEPTSGMDPSTEERLMRHFQAMARRGTTILITTHILYNLALLDRIVIMARGRLVFFGKPEEAMRFFTLEGRPLERPTQIFEALEHDPALGGEGADADPKDAIAEHYQNQYLESEYFSRHIGQDFSEVAQELLAVSCQQARKEGKPLPQTIPATSLDGLAATEARHYATLLENPTRRARGWFSFTANVFSPRAFKTLTQRQFAIKLVSMRRTLFYLAVPIILALVTLSLKTRGTPEEGAIRAEKEKIKSQLRQGPVDIGVPVKALLSPRGAAETRPAQDVVYGIRHEGVANLPVPLSVLLMFVMTAVFLGTLISCLDISTERPIWRRERMAGQNIADYIGSKLPFLMLVTAAQLAIFLALCRLKPGLRQFDLAGAYLALLGMAWASCAMGLCLSALDPSAGQFSVILAIVTVLPQLVFSGGLGPDFYQGMPRLMKGLAAVFPARWGLEMLMTAFYDQRGQAALEWVKGLVPEVIGFQFGPQVYWRNSSVLVAQGLIWLILCGLALRRLDRVR